jgi:hypothetical protein
MSVKPVKSVTPSIRVKCPAYLNPFRLMRVKPAKQDHGKQNILNQLWRAVCIPLITSRFKQN